MLILLFISTIYSLISLLKKIINEIISLREFFLNYLNVSEIVSLRKPFSNYLKKRLKFSIIKCLKEI